MLGFDLCLALSGIGPQARHPKYLMEYLSESEFSDWKVYFRMRPQGDYQIIRLVARAVWMLANAYRASDQPPVEFADVMPTIDTAELWEDIQWMIDEDRRLAGMSPEERNREAMEQWIAEHSRRMDKDADGVLEPE